MNKIIMSFIDTFTSSLPPYFEVWDFKMKMIVWDVNLEL